MPRLQWTEEHAIYLPEVDAEHRNLYLLMADLKKSALHAEPAEELDAKVRALLDDLEDHFSHEERLMREAHYAMYSWHKGQHDTLRKRSRQCAERLQAGDTKAVRDLIKFSSRWLQDHLAVADNMMGAAIRNYQRSHAA